VPANEFLNLEGQKLSTSRNWAIWLHEYLNDFDGQQDALRYALCSTAPESKDTDFTWLDFQTRNNSELVGIFGNFINRVAVLTNKYWEGTVPCTHEFDSYDKDIMNEMNNFPEKIGALIEQYKLREALTEFMNLARLGNKYLADTEPWKLKKTDEKRTETILNISLQIANYLMVLSEPFLPFTSDKLQHLLKVQKSDWNEIKSIEAGHKIGKPNLLFSKIEDDQIEFQVTKLGK